jgi:hypothetical protein
MSYGCALLLRPGCTGVCVCVCVCVCVVCACERAFCEYSVCGHVNNFLELAVESGRQDAPCCKQACKNSKQHEARARKTRKPPPTQRIFSSTHPQSRFLICWRATYAFWQLQTRCSLAYGNSMAQCLAHYTSQSSHSPLFSFTSAAVDILCTYRDIEIPPRSRT